MGEGGGKLCKENEAALHAARRARGGTREKTARASLFRNAAAPYTWNSIGHLSRSPRFFRVEFQRVTSRASRDPRAPRIGRSEAPCCVSASRRPRNSVSSEIRRLRDRDSLNLHASRSDSSKWSGHREDGREKTSETIPTNGRLRPLPIGLRQVQAMLRRGRERSSRRESSVKSHENLNVRAI